jgi:Concanavalin A-like lectin/glucanases superfamily
VITSGASLPAGHASRSLAIWFNNPGCCVSAELIRYGDVAGGRGFALFLRGGVTDETIELTGDKGKGIGVTLPRPGDTTQIADGDWHLISATYDGATARIYVDGALKGQGHVAAQTTVPGQGLVIGGANVLYSSAAIYAAALHGSSFVDQYEQSGAPAHVRCSLSSVYGVGACWRTGWHWFHDLDPTVNRNPDFSVVDIGAGEGIALHDSYLLSCDGNRYVAQSASIGKAIPASAIVG